MPEDQYLVLKGFCYFYGETGTEGGLWAFQNSEFILPREDPEEEGYPEEEYYYDYEGLHVLKNGDKLTIFSPNNPEEVIWSGTISLNYYPVFTESVFGLWIHADQAGIDRETWAKYFFENYPAELTTNRES